MSGIGYEPLDTPTLEAYEVLQGKIGQDEKLLYHFNDLGGREVGMRYDLTIPLARVVAMHANDLVLPFKRYHMGPVWRADRPQKGRFREFWQCDADMVGTRSTIADAEGVAVYHSVLSGLGFSQYEVRVNHRAVLRALAPYAGLPESAAPSDYPRDRQAGQGWAGRRQGGDGGAWYRGRRRRPRA